MSEVMENENFSSEEPNQSETVGNSESGVVGLLKEELQKAKNETEKAKQDFLYERAEFQNYKRRMSSDIQDVKRESVKKILISLLEPLDSLDKVIQSNPNPSTEMIGFLEGVKLIQKQMSSVLEKENVFKLDPKGESFDPSSMEAIASEDLEDLKEETVIEVFRPGYMFKEGDRSIALRTAMVKVGRPKF